jgi:hypothetical protein
MSYYSCSCVLYVYIPDAKKRCLSHFALHPHPIYKTTVIDLPTASFDPLWVLMKSSASYKRNGFDRWDDFFTVPNKNPSLISNPISIFFQGACLYVSLTQSMADSNPWRENGQLVFKVSMNKNYSYILYIIMYLWTFSYRLERRLHFSSVVPIDYVYVYYRVTVVQ